MRPHFRDIVRLEYNDASDASQFPVWRTLIARLPCLIESQIGREVEQGESLEGDIDYVVHTSFNTTPGRIRANMRLCVISGPLADMLLNINSVVYNRAAGRDQSMTFYCREKEPREVL